MIKDGQFRVKTDIMPVVPFELKTGALQEEGEYACIFMSKEYILANEDLFENFRELKRQEEKNEGDYKAQFMKMFRINNTVYNLLLPVFDYFKAKSIENGKVLNISKDYVENIQVIKKNSVIIRGTERNTLKSGYITCGGVEGILLKGDFVYSILENNRILEEEMMISEENGFNKLLKLCIM